jgi:hypothetical protein
LRAADLQFLLIALLLDAGVFLVKALKWRFIFQPIRRLPIGAFFSGIAVGALSTTVLPLRLDEFVRTYYFATRTGLRKATILGTIIVERLVDVSVLLSVLAVLALAFGSAIPVPAEGALLLLTCGLLGAGVVLTCLIVGAAPTASWLNRRGHASAGRAIAHLREGLISGLATFPRRRRLAGVFGFAVTEWLITVLHVAAVLRAFRVELSLVGDLAIVAAGYLSFALPSTPAAIGVYDLLVKTSLAIGFAVDSSTALAAALTLHFMLVVPISLAGAVVLLRNGLSVGGLRELARSERRAGQQPDPETHAR